MLKALYYSFLLILLATFSASAQTTDNEELRGMYKMDQSSRQVPNIDWTALSKSDSMREARVYELIQEGKLVTGKDHYHAVMIFQHGRDSVSYGMAVKHMRKAIELDSTINRWLLAAAIDRDLMSRSKPQIYGTQYRKYSENGKWERYKIDSTQVTDAERKYYGVETLAEQRLKERNMNLTQLSAYYAKNSAAEPLIKFIRAEKAKGKKSAYDVSEDGINSFAYELITAGKIEDAYRVFKLNTEFYPNSSNVFDSYGEVLLMLNRKEEGLRAYQKSLELNPKNQNAQAILNKNK